LSELVKAAQRGEAAGDGRFGVAGFVQSRNIAAEIKGSDLAGLGRVAVGLREVVGERSEVFAIRLLRQRGGIPLDAEEAEELGDGGVHRNYECRIMNDEKREVSSFIIHHSSFLLR